MNANLKGFATKLLFLTFVLAGVVAAQSAPPAPVQAPANTDPWAVVAITPAPKSQSIAPRKDIPSIAKAANGAIVTIVIAADDKTIIQGTGFLVRPDGVLVTNYHVIKTGTVAVVKFPDGTVLPVDGVLAADKARDLAVIKIHGKSFRTLALGNSDRVQVGEEVVAIGNPLSLESTVSNGIVSGVRTDEKLGGKFLQTTAPISPGSSGGPLFNMFDEVIGINTMYLEGGENLNFAIPVNDAKSLMQNHSAKLQNLPNEAPAPAEESAKQVRTSTLAEQKACKDAADSLVKRAENEAVLVEHSTYTNHFDPTSNACYVEIENSRMPVSPKILTQIFIRTIYNAFEDRIVGMFHETSIRSDDWKDRPSSAGEGYKVVGRYCSINPPGQEEIFCKTEKEFDALTLKYFGISAY